MSAFPPDDQTRERVSGQREVTRAKSKVALATLLVERGFFAHVEEARRWIMAGNVLVNEQRFDKPGMPVPRDAHVQIRGQSRYASRGGYKLEAALAHFAVDVAGCVALDCGASSGGFTDCLLQHGAAQVYAVEVGYGQLVGRLRIDPRVRNLERTNLGELTSALLTPSPELITLDLSYLSLARALPLAATLLAAEGQILALVKPLFEVESSAARRSGQIDDPALLIAALRRVLEAGCTCELSIQGIVKLALQPRHGVHEFIAAFVRYPGAECWRYDESLLAAIVAGSGVGETEIEKDMEPRL
jgi:23S rRNA (cytidine1920-2'-O)/16S rRNA (cytidine1409-2'-O)-methyltransferase